MKRMTALLLCAGWALTVSAHDCEKYHHEEGHDSPAVQDTLAEPATSDNSAKASGASTPEKPEVKNAVTEKAAAPEVTPAAEEKGVLQKFLDHPPASDAAKKRMKRH